jgi:hypothetical protein
MESSDRPDAPHLEYEFALEAFGSIATLLQERGATLMAQLNDGIGDTRYWDFKVDGEILTLHFEVQAGTMLYSARREGRAVLESLRSALDIDAHPILRTRDWWPYHGPGASRWTGLLSVPELILRAAVGLAAGAMGLFGCFCVYWGVMGALHMQPDSTRATLVRFLLAVVVGLAFIYVAFVRAPWHRPSESQRRAI